MNAFNIFFNLSSFVGAFVMRVVVTVATLKYLSTFDDITTNTLRIVAVCGGIWIITNGIQLKDKSKSKKSKPNKEQPNERIQRNPERK